MKNKSGLLKKNLAESSNEFKDFEGKLYGGMKIGRGHKWYYDKGEWKEKKVSPDQWQFEYTVNKRRKRTESEGRGVPVGTEYHWYILSHQNVRKLDANTYATAMTGLKYKLSHKRAHSDRWSTTEKTQKKKLIKLLLELAGELASQIEDEEKIHGIKKELINKKFIPSFSAVAM
jgi:hypothetical protein